MRSIAVQGVGFGALALAVQGFLYVAIEVPVAPPHIESYNRLFNRLPTEDLPRKISARVRLQPEQVERFLAHPAVAANARIGIEPSLTIAKTAEVHATAGSKLLVLPIKVGSTSGKLLASGRHDLSDEELAAMLLEILDAT